MKANEIMVGDWFAGADNKPYKVEKIFTDNPDVAFNGQFIKPIIDLEPIPITQEMLEYNFIDMGHYQYGNLNEFQELRISVYSDGIYEVKVEEIEFSSLPTWKMYVSHVHELQHALRLCGLADVADDFNPIGGEQ